MPSHAVLLTQLLKIRTALSIKPTLLQDLSLRGWTLSLLFWEGDLKLIASPWGPFGGISSLEAVFCHTLHSKCKPLLTLGSCTQKNSHDAASCSKLPSASILWAAEGKSQYNAVVYQWPHIIISCNTHGNCPELQRRSAWLGMAPDRWKQCWQLVGIAMQIASGRQPITRYRPVRRSTVKTDWVHRHLQGSLPVPNVRTVLLQVSESCPL